VCFYTVSAVRVRYRMRSTDTSQSVHGFCYSGPTAWNSILSDAHDITDTNTFKNGSWVYSFILLIGDYCAALLDVVYNGALQISISYWYR